MDDVVNPQPERPQRRKPSFLVRVVNFLFDGVFAGMQRNIALIFREIDLFLGTALTIVGLLGFESDKYCDGNTADYLSCTRPTTYYFFDALDILFVVVGVFFIILWFVKKR